MQNVVLNMIFCAQDYVKMGISAVDMDEINQRRTRTIITKTVTPLQSIL